MHRHDSQHVVDTESGRNLCCRWEDDEETNGNTSDASCIRKLPHAEDVVVVCGLGWVATLFQETSGHIQHTGARQENKNQEIAQ